MRALVVDEDAAVRSLVSTALAAEGWEVVAVHGRDRGLEGALDGTFDVAFLDLVAPSPSALEWLIRRPTLASIPRIVMTSHDSPAARTLARALGAAAYLVKSVDAERVVAAAWDLVSDPDPSGGRRLGPAPTPAPPLAGR